MVLGDLTYELGLDGDPNLATDFLFFDNISPSMMTPFWDHAIGDNTTGNGGGTVAVDAADYLGLIAAENVAQNSWRYDFFNGMGTELQDFDPALDGTYAIYLLARDAEGAVVARSDIQILIGDAEPAGPQLACRGFEPPLNEAATVPNAGRALPLRLHLADALGLPLSDAEIQANPVAQSATREISGVPIPTSARSRRPAGAPRATASSSRAATGRSTCRPRGSCPASTPSPWFRATWRST